MNEDMRLRITAALDDVIGQLVGVYSHLHPVKYSNQNEVGFDLSSLNLDLDKNFPYPRMKGKYEDVPRHIIGGVEVMVFANICATYTEEDRFRVTETYRYGRQEHSREGENASSIISQFTRATGAVILNKRIFYTSHQDFEHRVIIGAILEKTIPFASFEIAKRTILKDIRQYIEIGRALQR